MNSYMVLSNELMVKSRLTSLKDLQRFGSFPKSFTVIIRPLSINSLDKTKFLVHSPTDSNYEPTSIKLSFFPSLFFSFIT